MSCFSRLLGLICAVLPGLLFLAFSALFFTKWPQLGYVAGPLYSLVSLITGGVCLYLGIGILFDRDHTPELVADQTPQSIEASTPVAIEAQPLQAAPLPTTPLVAAPLPTTPLAAAPLATEIVEPPRAVATGVDAATPPESSPIATEKAPAATPPDSPERRIRRLASTRPQWQVTAPQLAHMANLNMAVADATAREMASNGQAQLQAGPHGETVYVFDLADSAD